MIKQFRPNAKNWPFLAVWLLLAAAMTPGAAAQLQETVREGVAPFDRVTVLLNGSVLHGRVTKVGDFYHVAIEGGEIRLRSAEVDFVCRDIEEAYQRKRAQLVHGSAHDHANLARWLQRHGLLDQAARELAVAGTLDPRHPMIPLVRRRLESSLAQRDSIAIATGPPATPAVPTVSSKELDRMTSELPRSAVETFTRTIQPLLSNRCATAACHGPGCENDFAFNRLSYSGSPSRRTTQRNLHATLEWIDRSRPSASKLLTVPAGAHGKTGPIFSNHDAHLVGQLAVWVGQFADAGASGNSGVFGRGPTPSPAAATGAVRALHVSPSAALGEETWRVEPAGFSADVLQLEIQQDGLLTPFGPPDKPAIQRGGQPPSFVPIDPWDPAIFNRRFHPPLPGR